MPQEAAIAAWLAAQKEAMLALLADLVNIDSGSYDRAGVEAVGERLVRFYEENGLVIEREPHETFAPAIHVKLDDKRANEKPIVLMGHRDTVFPKGEVAKVHAVRNTLPSLPDGSCQAVVEACESALLERFGKLPTLGKCWIDPSASFLTVSAMSTSSSTCSGKIETCAPRATSTSR